MKAYGHVYKVIACMILLRGVGGERVKGIPYIGYIAKCGSKGYDFSESKSRRLSDHLPLYDFILSAVTLIFNFMY